MTPRGRGHLSRSDRRNRMGMLRRGVVVAWMLMLVAGSAAAQQTGRLSGVVRDAQGAVLPGVTITASSAALIGGTRTAVTGAGGGYQFSDLPPGIYTVSYELPGF